MIILKIDQTVQALATLSIQHTAKPERMRRALRFFSLFFILFIISIFIPVLHFFLSPLFLALAFWQFFAKLNEKFELDFNHIHCPKCAQSFHQGKVYSKSNIFKEYCPTCRYTLTIEAQN